MERINYPLGEDQRETRRNDNSYLLRISDDQLKFEFPTPPAGNAEMQSGTDIDTVTRQARALTPARNGRLYSQHAKPSNIPFLLLISNFKLSIGIERFQLDIAARLQASAFFANVPVFILRPS